MDRQSIIPIYMDYVNNGGIISPMNTESCRRYLEKKLGETVEHEDVLWMFYHAKLEINPAGREGKHGATKIFVGQR